MDDTRALLAGLIGPCPECGNGTLRPVAVRATTNFLCQECGACWHAEFDWVRRVDPESCPGCPVRGLCLEPRRPYAVPGPRAAEA